MRTQTQTKVAIQTCYTNLFHLKAFSTSKGRRFTLQSESVLSCIKPLQMIRPFLIFFCFAQLESRYILLSDTSNAAFCILMHPDIFFSFHELCIIHEDSVVFNVMQLAHGIACALCIGKTKQKKDNWINRSRRNKCDFLQFQFLCGDFLPFVIIIGRKERSSTWWSLLCFEIFL